MGVAPAGFNQAVTNYNNLVLSQEYDVAKLKYLVGLLKDRAPGEASTDAAFMMAMEVVMPQMTQAQGDDSSVMGGQLDIANVCAGALQNVTQDIQWLANPSTIPAGQTANQVAENLVGTVDFFLGIFKNNTPPWIDSATATSVTNALTSFQNMFGGSADFNASTVQAAIQQWATNPTQTYGTTGQTGVEEMQQLAGDASGATTAFTSSSTTLSAQIQNEMGVIGQIMGAMQSILQSLISFLNAVNASSKVM